VDTASLTNKIYAISSLRLHPGLVSRSRIAFKMELQIVEWPWNFGCAGATILLWLASYVGSSFQKMAAIDLELRKRGRR
jgi:hypothetical protein